MTDVLTVPTHFGDLSELSHGLIDRVDDGRIILYGPTMFDEGAHVGFRVLLSDESTALEGYGRVTEVYDGGEEREPEIRYDTVLESLELDGRNEVVFERIVMARLSLTGEGDPPTGEVDISELQEQANVEVEAPAFNDATDFAVAEFASADPAPADDLSAAVDFAAPAADFAEPADFAAPIAAPAEATDFAINFGVDGTGEAAAEVEVDVGLDVDVSADIGGADAEFEAPVEYETPEFEDVGDDAFESLAPAAPIDVAPPRVALGTTNGALVRPVFAASWWPRAEAPEPGPSTGWFQYAAGTLPVPPQAPRPDLSPELRVAPAPRPSADGEVAAPAPAVSDAVVGQAAVEAVVEHAAVEHDAVEHAAVEHAEDVLADDVLPEPSDEATQSFTAGEDDSPFDEMPLPADDAEIAPAVEAEYVSVGDASPVDAGLPEESFADLDAEQLDADVDVELDL